MVKVMDNNCKKMQIQSRLLVLKNLFGAAWIQTWCNISKLHHVRIQAAPNIYFKTMTLKIQIQVKIQMQYICKLHENEQFNFFS